MSHLANFSDEQLVGAIKPLLVHQNWEYLEEYLRREYQKQAGVGMKSKELHDIFRAQGQCTAIANLGNLKAKLMGAS